MNAKASQGIRKTCIAVAGIAGNGAILAALPVGFLLLLTGAMAEPGGPTRTEFFIEIWPLVAGTIAGAVANVLIIVDRWKAAAVTGLAAAGLVIWYVKPLLYGQ